MKSPLESTYVAQSGGTVGLGETLVAEAAVEVGETDATGAVELTDCGLSSPLSLQANARTAINPRTGRIQSRDMIASYRRNQACARRFGLSAGFYLTFDKHFPIGAARQAGRDRRRPCPRLREIVERGSLGPPPAGYMPPPSYAPPVTFPSTSTPPPAAPPSGPTDPAEALRQLSDLRTKKSITDEEYQAKRRAILDRL